MHDRRLSPSARLIRGNSWLLAESDPLSPAFELHPWCVLHGTTLRRTNARQPHLNVIGITESRSFARRSGKARTSLYAALRYENCSVMHRTFDGLLCYADNHRNP